MPSDPTLPSTDIELNLLRQVVDSGLLRCGVPRRLGGSPDGLDALAAGAAEFATHRPGAAWLLWAQRMAIEALLQSPNFGLRELWLADFLSGERAATLAPSFNALQAHDTGRGWLLDGQLVAVPNLQWAGFSLVAPVRLQGPDTHWVLLRGEEDGLYIGPHAGGKPPGHALIATLQLKHVFFREDEYLDGPDLPQRLAPVASALAASLPARTDWDRMAQPQLPSHHTPPT
ncbi:hypothetical protein [Hydrogenophaga sp.]|uniref:hypothetical protein n=1 Tax=Hydrogenophaga sp. TaxID=1904254 RepID=UPI00272FE4EE|nr:hypothetical protein [Hydrogenophaga sp.]MDP1687051.1 hypothetical protein [Hydrogenophaga sp.]